MGCRAVEVDQRGHHATHSVPHQPDPITGIAVDVQLLGAVFIHNTPASAILGQPVVFHQLGPSLSAGPSEGRGGGSPPPPRPGPAYPPRPPGRPGRQPLISSSILEVVEMSQKYPITGIAVDVQLLGAVLVHNTAATAIPGQPVFSHQMGPLLSAGPGAGHQEDGGRDLLLLLLVQARHIHHVHHGDQAGSLL